MSLKDIYYQCWRLGALEAQAGGKIDGKKAIEVSAKYGLTGHVAFQEGYNFIKNLTAIVYFAAKNGGKI